MAEGDLETVRSLVPQTTFDYIMEMIGGEDRRTDIETSGYAEENRPDAAETAQEGADQ